MKIQFRIAILLFTMIACAGSAKDAQKGSLGMQGSIPEIIVENPPSNTGAHYEYLTPYASESKHHVCNSDIEHCRES